MQNKRVSEKALKVIKQETKVSYFVFIEKNAIVAIIHPINIKNPPINIIVKIPPQKNVFAAVLKRVSPVIS